MIDGRLSCYTLTFNTSTEHFFKPVVDKARRVNLIKTDKTGTTKVKARDEKFSFLINLNMKYLNMANRSIESGEEVERVVFQPEVKKPYLKIFNKTFYKSLIKSSVTILTNKELIVIRGPRDPVIKLGGIRHFIPLDRIEDVSVSAADSQDMAYCIIKLYGNDQLKIDFENVKLDEIHDMLGIKKKKKLKGLTPMKKTPNIKKTASLLALISITQVFALAVLTIYALSDGKVLTTERFYSQFMLIVIIVAASLASSLMSLRFRGMLIKSNSRNHALEGTVGDMEKLNQTLRAQRHDFLNHLQVVYGLIEMDEYKDARDYIERVYNDIQKISKVMKTSNTAINALLQAKILTAQKKGIVTEFNATSRLDNLPIPSWEMCRILGNLMDNAINALEEKPADRLLKLDLSEDLKFFYFKIEDNGPGIPENLQNKIFEPGFTTKGDNGEGMGLAITKEILLQYGGDVTVSSNDLLTLFEVTIPKQP